MDDLRQLRMKIEGDEGYDSSGVSPKDMDL